MKQAEIWLETIREDAFLRPMLAAYEHALPYAKDKMVLDFGCGYGWGSYLLCETAAGVVGYDPAADRISQAKSVFESNHLRFTFSLGKQYINRFDVLCLFWVMGAAENPGRVLGQLRQYLKPGGALLIATKRSVYQKIPALRDFGAETARLYFNTFSLSGRDDILEWGLRFSGEGGGIID